MTETIPKAETIPKNDTIQNTLNTLDRNQEQEKIYSDYARNLQSKLESILE